jgi:hypothetical protein
MKFGRLWKKKPPGNQLMHANWAAEGFSTDKSPIFNKKSREVLPNFFK